MSVHVRIETASKADAEVVAALLQATARVESSRGYGVIRLGLLTASQTQQVIKAAAQAVEAHGVPWARVRYDDEERLFRANHRRHASPGTRTAKNPTSSPDLSGSGSPPTRVLVARDMLDAEEARLGAERAAEEVRRAGGEGARRVAEEQARRAAEEAKRTAAEEEPRLNEEATRPALVQALHAVHAAVEEAKRTARADGATRPTPPAVEPPAADLPVASLYLPAPRPSRLPVARPPETDEASHAAGIAEREQSEAEQDARLPIYRWHAPPANLEDAPGVRDDS